MDKDLSKDFPPKTEEDKDEENQLKEQGLEFCPFCPFTITLTTKPEEDKIFICKNKDCAIRSCRLCKKAAHAPYSCDSEESQGFGEYSNQQSSQTR